MTDSTPTRFTSEALKDRAALLLAAVPLCLALVACGGEAPSGESESVPAAVDQASAAGSEAPSDVPAGAETPEPLSDEASNIARDDYLGGGYEGVLRAGTNDVPQRTPGTLRLASYNVLNLFDDKDDPALQGSQDDLHSRGDELRAKPAPQLEAVAAAIRAIDADVIGFQEIESEQALLWFRDNHLADLGYEHHVSVDVEHGRGIEQSVLSRFPIVEHQVWPRKPLGVSHPTDPAVMQRSERDKAGQEIVFRRSPLFAMIEVPATGSDPMTAEQPEPYRLGLLVIHHKSGRQNDYWRNAEANVVVQIASEKLAERPEMNLAILGDFNATPDKVSVTTYADQLGMIDTLADRNPGDPAYLTHASGRVIDFILVNENLNAEIVPDSAFVYATPLRPREMDWRETPPPTGYAADHMPVVIDIHIGDR